jgi:DNA mismatch endonuclease, patch repair protein
MVFPRFRAVVFVHGCFWHGHDCHLFRWPSSRHEFWREKIGANIDRDRRTVEHLQEEAWRVLTIWECALRGKCRLHLESVLDQAEQWIREAGESRDIRGQNNGNS